MTDHNRGTPAALGEAVTVELLEGDAEPILAQMRAEQPVCWVPALGMWFVTRWDDVVALEADPDTFTAATEPSFLARALGVNMLTLDPPEATRLQDTMKPSFQPRGVAGDFVSERLEGLADNYVARCSRELAEHGRVDLMTSYAAPLSSAALADVLGLDQFGADAMWRWCEGICTDIANFGNDPGKAAIGAAAKAELGEALRSRLSESGLSVGAQSNPAAGVGVGDGAESSAEHNAGGDLRALGDFLSNGPDGDPLSEAEIVNNVRLMISGGINEPRDGIGLVLWTLLTRPDLAKRVADEPAKWPKLVEEVLRRHSPVGTVTRQATKDTELGGASIAKGDLVSGILRSINLDENRFANPTEIDLDRTERGHAAFAVGFHRCLGEWLGRQEIRVGARRLWERIDRLRLAEPVELAGFEFRGPTSLVVSPTRR